MFFLAFYNMSSRTVVTAPSNSLCRSSPWSPRITSKVTSTWSRTSRHTWSRPSKASATWGWACGTSRWSPSKRWRTCWRWSKRSPTWSPSRGSGWREACTRTTSLRYQLMTQTPAALQVCFRNETKWIIRWVSTVQQLVTLKRLSHCWLNKTITIYSRLNSYWSVSWIKQKTNFQTEMVWSGFLGPIT